MFFLSFQSTHSRGVRLVLPPTSQTERCFNPRTHEECDQIAPLCTISYAGFNPRTHEECDLAILTGRTSLLCFNPRTHEECDLFTRMADLLRRSFNPRTHEECDNSPKRSQMFQDCFNPRTHEECDPIRRYISHHLAVSIHALTRSATFYKTLGRDSFVVSIHALTRSATCCLASLILRLQVSIHALTRSATYDSDAKVGDQLFQSTHSRGVRPFEIFAVSWWFVSIHALTRSATISINCTCSDILCFNPRTHEECDFCFITLKLPMSCFNPRTHEECDRTQSPKACDFLFQSTHSRGVRRKR